MEGQRALKRHGGYDAAVGIANLYPAAIEWSFQDALGNKRSRVNYRSVPSLSKVGELAARPIVVDGTIPADVEEELRHGAFKTFRDIPSRHFEVRQMSSVDAQARLFQNPTYCEQDLASSQIRSSTPGLLSTTQIAIKAALNTKRSRTIRRGKVIHYR